MSATTPAGDAATLEGGADGLTDWQIRGLTEYLVVLPRDAAGMFTIYSEDGSPNTVDIDDTGACTCADAEYNDPAGGCKYEAAARFMTGDRPIPAWADADAINSQLARTSTGTE